MVTMAQRIEQLRTEKGLSRPALSLALGLPKNAAEKFETGRATPIAYATCTSARRASPAATTFFATWRAA